MTTFFVSRHPGAVAWLARQGLAVDRTVAHLDLQEVQRGDTVIGTLPVHLAAQVCERSGRYVHLRLDMPADLRGLELDADALERPRTPQARHPGSPPMTTATLRRPLSPARFRLISHWHLEAPHERVWDALTAPDQWPAWWPHVRSAQVLRPGAADGLGARHRLAWGSRLPYGLAFETEVIQVRRPWLLRARVRGDLNGLGTWELTPEGSAGTRVRYLWCVEPGARWMRLLAPLAAPLFRWNHRAVMRDGARGLARHLGAPLIDAR